MPRKVPDNWRSRIEWKYERNRHSFEFIVRFKSNKIPRNFQREIGRLIIDDSLPYIVSDVQVKEAFRRKGLGLKLYERAVKKLGKISTVYYEASKEAQNLWKKLRKTYRSRKSFFTGVLTIYNKKRT